MVDTLAPPPHSPVSPVPVPSGSGRDERYVRTGVRQIGRMGGLYASNANPVVGRGPTGRSIVVDMIDHEPMVRVHHPALESPLTQQLEAQ